LGTVRLIVKFKGKSYYICKDWNNNFYRVINNEHIGNRKVGDDFYIYFKEGKEFILKTIIPISDEEAGVKVLNTGF